MCMETKTVTSGMQSLQTRKERKQSFLKSMYIATSLLSVYMVFWILIFPASWLGGRSKLHDDLIEQYVPNDGITPQDIVTKYAGQTAVHLTHNLPGALWAALIPFQLHPSFRKSRPTLHRRFGYAFVASALLIAVGIGIIMRRKLMFNHFFPDLPPEDISPEYGASALAVYFVVTILMALRLATQRRFADHQRWIIRHISSGIWIAVQRILLTMVYSAIYKAPVPRMTQRHSFGEAAQIATGICMALGELTIYVMRPENNKKRVD